MPNDSLYGLAVLPAGALSPSVAGFGGLTAGIGVGVGVAVGVTGVASEWASRSRRGSWREVGVGVGPMVIDGGVAYWLGQMEGIIPAE